MKIRAIAMDKTQLEIERGKWVRHIPQSYRPIYRKAMKGRSMAAAIRAKCQDCCNWQRVEVRECTVVCCPLHDYRPYRKSENRKSIHQGETLEKKVAKPAEKVAGG
jgi:hypothetical protein